MKVTVDPASPVPVIEEPLAATTEGAAGAVPSAKNVVIPLVFPATSVAVT